jgi:hypothetical protein
MDTTRDDDNIVAAAAVFFVFVVVATVCERSQRRDVVARYRTQRVQYTYGMVVSLSSAEAGHHG